MVLAVLRCSDQRSANRRCSVAAPALKRSLRLHLVLDLDHTLLHTLTTNEFWVLTRGYNENIPPPDAVCLKYRWYTFFRPGLHEFLNWAFANCLTVSVFTAGDQGYANWIVKSIVPHGKQFYHVMSHSSVEKLDGQPVKPLYKLWSTEKAEQASIHEGNTIIVDDLQCMFRLNPRNGLHIKPFNVSEDYMCDDALRDIIPRIEHRFMHLRK